MFRKKSPCGANTACFSCISMHRSCLNTQFEALFRSLRFTYEAYILGLIQMEAARLRILTFYDLHTTLIPLHELKLDRSVAAFPTLYASHTTLIPLHELELRSIRRAFLVIYPLHTMVIPLHELRLGPIRRTFPIIYRLHRTVIP